MRSTRTKDPQKIAKGCVERPNATKFHATNRKQWKKIWEFNSHSGRSKQKQTSHSQAKRKTVVWRKAIRSKTQRNGTWFVQNLLTTDWNSRTSIWIGGHIALTGKQKQSPIRSNRTEHCQEDQPRCQASWFVANANACNHHNPKNFRLSPGLGESLNLKSKFFPLVDDQGFLTQNIVRSCIFSWEFDRISIFSRDHHRWTICVLVNLAIISIDKNFRFISDQRTLHCCRMKFFLPVLASYTPERPPSKETLKGARHPKQQWVSTLLTNNTTQKF